VRPDPLLAEHAIGSRWVGQRLARRPEVSVEHAQLAALYRERDIQRARANERDPTQLLQ
jgi:hypothetical protein